ncbi:MAG: methionine--tRNA ligase [Candidatus Micrarchaeia archaeon]
MQEKKILITSALPYVNNVPHLGNIIGCVLSADVFARFCRARGRETIFVCGTDEYGTATETKALEEGVSPKELCDKYYKIHKEIYEWFGISTDIFGRTSTPLHTKITQEIFLDLYNNGHVVEEEVEQAYDEKAGMFLADRYIEGTCPYCKSDGARADQCDKCGHLLNFDELINPVSKVSKTTPTKRKSRHLFIDLPGIEAKLEKWIEESSKKGFWSENSYSIAKAWLAEGLKKRAITRDLKWGVPVPLKGWEDKVFYVWFDAPIGYISITANYTEKWKEWWLNPQGVELYQFMGKDNVPFHTVIFPSTLMGTGKDWTLLHHISTTEFLNYEGGKFSKSRGVGVFGNDAVASGIAPDVWRYYLLTNRPEKMDTNFTWKDFGEKANNELLANLGNLVNRTMVFTQREFAGVVPEPKLSGEDRKFVESQKAILENAGNLLEKAQIKEALHQIMHAGKQANAYFQANEPWKAAKEDREKCQSTIYVLLNQVHDLAIAISPYLPNTARSIFAQLGAKQGKWGDIGSLAIKPGHRLGKPEILFRKIEQVELDRLASRFSGNQKEDALHAKEAETKKQAKKQEKPPSPPILAQNIDFEVGVIEKIERHPQADKLYVEQIRLSDGARQVVSGLVPYYKEEELLGKKVILVKNLKTAMLRGMESKGMVLAAEDDTGVVEVISPEGAIVGAKAVIAGKEPAPMQEITIDQFFQIELAAKDGIAYAQGAALEIDGAPVRTAKVKDGRIR